MPQLLVSSKCYKGFLQVDARLHSNYINQLINPMAVPWVTIVILLITLGQRDQLIMVWNLIYANCIRCTQIGQDIIATHFAQTWIKQTEFYNNNNIQDTNIRNCWWYNALYDVDSRRWEQSRLHSDCSCAPRKVHWSRYASTAVQRQAWNTSKKIQ